MPSTVELRSWRTSEVQVISHMRIADLFGRAFPFLAHSNTLLSLPVLHLPVSLSFTHPHLSCPFLSFIFLSPYPSPIRTLPVPSCPSSSCLQSFTHLQLLPCPPSLIVPLSLHPSAPFCTPTPFLSFTFLSPCPSPYCFSALHPSTPFCTPTPFLSFTFLSPCPSPYCFSALLHIYTLPVFHLVVFLSFCTSTTFLSFTLLFFCPSAHLHPSCLSPCCFPVLLHIYNLPVLHLVVFLSFCTSTPFLSLPHPFRHLPVPSFPPPYCSSALLHICTLPVSSCP